jgi:hypothetical protein
LVASALLARVEVAGAGKLKDCDRGEWIRELRPDEDMLGDIGEFGSA